MSNEPCSVSYSQPLHTLKDLASSSQYMSCPQDHKINQETNQYTARTHARWLWFL